MLTANLSLEIFKADIRLNREPALQQLLDACRAGHANLVVVTDVSRFSRNLALRVEVIAQLQEMGAGIKVIH